MTTGRVFLESLQIATYHNVSLLLLSLSVSLTCIVFLDFACVIFENLYT